MNLYKWKITPSLDLYTMLYKSIYNISIGETTEIKLTMTANLDEASYWTRDDIIIPEVDQADETKELKASDIPSGDREDLFYNVLLSFMSRQLADGISKGYYNWVGGGYNVLGFGKVKCSEITGSKLIANLPKPVILTQVILFGEPTPDYTIDINTGAIWKAGVVISGISPTNFQLITPIVNATASNIISIKSTTLAPTPQDSEISYKLIGLEL